MCVYIDNLVESIIKKKKAIKTEYVRRQRDANES